MSAERDRLAALLPGAAGQSIGLRSGLLVLCLTPADATALADELEAGRVAVEQVKRLVDVIDNTEWNDWPGASRFKHRVRRALDGTTS